MKQPRKRKSTVPDTATNTTSGVELRASAKLEASAKYEVKKTVQEVIPEDVTRAKVGAWLTIISPITHWAGLKGDELRYKRELLRLQQEETLLKIAKKYDKRRNKEKPTKQVPPKFLVPFLERASLEQPDSDLVDLWSNLLVSAAEEYNPHYVHFTSIISQLSSVQARLFAGLVKQHEEIAVIEEAYSLSMGYIDDCINKAYEEYLSIICENVTVFIGDVLESKGFVWASIAYESSNTLMRMRRGINFEVDYSILMALGLVKIVKAKVYSGDKDEESSIEVEYYDITTLGLAFAEACRLS